MLKFNEFWFWKRKTLHAICIQSYCRINRTPRARNHINITSAPSTGIEHRRTGIRHYLSVLPFSLRTQFARNSNDSVRARWRSGRRNENESKIIIRPEQQQLHEYTKLQKKKYRACCVPNVNETENARTIYSSGDSVHGHRYLTISENGRSVAFVQRSCRRFQPPACQCALPFCRSLTLYRAHTHIYTNTGRYWMLSTRCRLLL